MKKKVILLDNMRQIYSLDATLKIKKILSLAWAFRRISDASQFPKVISKTVKKTAQRT